MKTASFSRVSVEDCFLAEIVPRIVTICSNLSLWAPMNISGDLRSPKARNSFIDLASSISSVKGMAATKFPIKEAESTLAPWNLRTLPRAATALSLACLN